MESTNLEAALRALSHELAWPPVPSFAVDVRARLRAATASPHARENAQPVVSGRKEGGKE
jgi:hypothetical protein